MSASTTPSNERFASRRALEIAATFPQQTSISREGLISLGGGTPDFATPPHIVEAGCKALRDGHTTYTAWLGIPPLREAIAEKLQRENNLKVDPENEILVTAGSQAAMNTVSLALVDPGDELIIPAPFYGEWRRDMMLADGRLVPVPTKRENSFEVDPEASERAITPKTKGIVLVSPSNPTGGIIQRPTLERIAEIAQAHDLLVISDELYEHFMYDDFEHFSIGSLPGMWQRTVTLNSFSKHYGMTGWRVAYMVAPSEIIRAILPIHHNVNICAASASQWAALAAVTGPHDWFDDILADYDRRRKTWMKALDEMGLPYGYPQGAYYIMFDVTSTGLSSREFSQKARAEAKVVVGGGGGAVDPSTEGFCRGSFVAPIDRLEEGLSRMKSVVDKLKAEKS
jgi:aminotransferase